MKFIKITSRLFFGFYRYQKKAFHYRNVFHLDNLVATVSIFIVFFLLGQLGDRFQVLDPLGDAFQDVELTDVAFSRLGKNKGFRSQNNDLGEEITLTNQDITLINIGNCRRPEIAQLLNIINQHNPKVVGIDAFFRNLKPGEQFQYDMMLAEALSNTQNLVLVSESENFNHEELICDSLSYSHEMFNQFAHTGTASMYVKNDQKVVRKFAPYIESKKEKIQEPFFALKIAELYDSTCVKKLQHRNRKIERINYSGNIHIPFYDELYSDKSNAVPLEDNYYLTYDYHQVLSNEIDPATIKDRIILIGFLGDPIYVGEGEDKFYTPLNDQYIGKADRDMFGVVIHANIISMLLRGNYIDEMPDWLMHVIGLIFVYLTIANFRPLYFDYKIWYDGVSKIIGFFIALVVLGLIGMVFEFTNYELKFGSIYFACILLAGDFLEIYYGMLKNVINLFRFS